MDDYTLTTEDVLAMFLEGVEATSISIKVYVAQFDRWLREVKSEAWVEGEAAGWNNANAADWGKEIVNHNPYRPRENYLKDLRD